MPFLALFLLMSSGALVLAFIEWAVSLRSLGGLRRALSARQNPDEILAHGRRWHECNDRAKGSPLIFMTCILSAVGLALLGVIGSVLGWRVD